MYCGLFTALEFYLKESSSVGLEVESSPEGLHLLLRFMRTSSLGSLKIKFFSSSPRKCEFRLKMLMKVEFFIFFLLSKLMV